MTTRVWMVAGTLILGTALLLAQGGPSYVTTQRFDDYARMHAREHQLEAQAVAEARAAMNIRLDSMNELRNQINIERGAYQTTNEAAAVHALYDQRIRVLEQAQATQAGSTLAWTAAIAIFFIVVQIAIRFFPRNSQHRIGRGEP